ncbi:hypothetical protein PF70_01843 [Pseudomonas asplenii]|nr:hypothetical protein PF70_01843 [Pseudomonas fuscovaginae]
MHDHALQSRGVGSIEELVRVYSIHCLSWIRLSIDWIVHRFVGYVFGNGVNSGHLRVLQFPGSSRRVIGDRDTLLACHHLADLLHHFDHLGDCGVSFEPLSLLSSINLGLFRP